MNCPSSQESALPPLARTRSISTSTHGEAYTPKTGTTASFTLCREGLQRPEALCWSLRCGTKRGKNLSRRAISPLLGEVQIIDLSRRGCSSGRLGVFRLLHLLSGKKVSGKRKEKQGQQVLASRKCIERLFFSFSFSLSFSFSHVSCTAEASRLVTNRSSNPDAIAYYYAEASRIMGGSLANTMEVQTIAVVPGFQRAGIGKVALKWCFDMAEAENVPVVGDASKKGINLYLQTGFKIQGTIVMEAKVARLDGRDDVVVEMPRLEVPVVTWTPGTPRRVRLVSVL